MLKVYCTGCVSCHPAIKKLQYNNLPFIVEDNYDIVMKKVTETIGIVPVFEFNDKYYNEKEIESMVDNGYKFEIPIVLETKINKKEVVKEA